MFRLKGSILSMSFLDCNGALIPYSYEPWKDENRSSEAGRRDRNKMILSLNNINLLCSNLFLYSFLCNSFTLGDNRFKYGQFNVQIYRLKVKYSQNEQLSEYIHICMSSFFLACRNGPGTPTKQGSNRMSPTLGAGSSSGSTDSFGDRQFIAITSEKTARVIALPSQNCVYRQQIADTDYVVKAEVISLKGTRCDN